MSVKAKLIVSLRADETVVAESEDPELWQRVLVAINTKSMPDAAPRDALPSAATPAAPSVSPGSLNAGVEIERFANELGVTTAQLIGACDPRTSAPYLHLNSHCWEALKRNTPERGPGALGPMVLGSTLMVLWFRSARLGTPKQADVHETLGTIGLVDKNPTRALKNCEWLQSRSGAIYLNPAETSKAIAVAKAYCVKQPPEINS